MIVEMEEEAGHGGAGAAGQGGPAATRPLAFDFVPDARRLPVLRRLLATAAAAVAATAAVLAFVVAATTNASTAQYGSPSRGGRVALLAPAATANASILAAALGVPAYVALAMDPSVSPCEDFYSYACGGWVASTAIPADKPLIARSFDGAASEVHKKLRSLYEEAYPEDSAYRPLADFYASCMNTTLLEELGASPLAPMLQRIDGLSSVDEVGRIIADFIAGDMPSPVKLSVASAGGPTKVMFVNGGGFILPDASFYKMAHMQHEAVFSLPPDPHEAERQRLEAYYRQLNQLAGYSDEESKQAASSTIALETIMAHWTLEEPPIHAVVLDKLESLEQVVSSVPWRLMFSDMALRCEKREGIDAAKRCLGSHRLILDAQVVLLGSPRFLSQLELLIRTQDPSLWIRYLRTHYLYNSATQLDHGFLEANLAMDASVTGIRAQPARAERCVKLVASSGLSDLSEKAFMQRFFRKDSDEYREAMELLQDVKKAFVTNIDSVPWMDADTKREALEKANNMALNLGGPASAYDEAGKRDAPFAVNRSALVRNVELSAAAKMEWEIEGIGSMVNEGAGEWSMTATTVNAYYDGSKNAMFVPAGTLQMPFFSLDRPMALNFGALGAIMGHEMTHGFDLNGARLDAQGRERDWWTLEAANQFKERSKCVDTVFNVVGLPRLFARPLTLSEDLADVGGVKVALMGFQAWHARKHGTEASEQDLKRFFLAFSQNWCYKERPQERAVLINDVHAPGELRSNGPLSMTDDFSSTFTCGAGTRMNPAEKCGMWKDITGDELLFQTRLKQIANSGLGKQQPTEILAALFK
jgi:putative endopeptidase